MENYFLCLRDFIDIVNMARLKHLHHDMSVMMELVENDDPDDWYICCDVWSDDIHVGSFYVDHERYEEICSEIIDRFVSELQ